MSGFSFEYPALLLLIPLYTLTIFALKKKEQAYFIPHILQRVSTTQKRGNLRNILKHFTLFSLIIALASPIKTEHPIDKERHTQDIVLSIDTSGSMSLVGLNPNDYKQTRLDVVQSVVKAFIKKRAKDRIGLVVFGDSSSVALPLSEDQESILSVVDKITIGILGKSTALIDSIVSASSLLKNSFSSSKIIILLSDGDDTASRVPLETALKIAKKYKIKIYTIAIGESNNNLLQLISKESGARSFTASNQNDLQEVYRSITALEAATHNSNRITLVHYYYNYPLYSALFLALLLAFVARKDEVV